MIEVSEREATGRRVCIDCRKTAPIPKPDNRTVGVTCPICGGGVYIVNAKP